MKRYIIVICILLVSIIVCGCCNTQNINQQQKHIKSKQEIVYDTLHKENQLLLEKTGYACNIVEEYDIDTYSKDMLQYIFDDMESMGYQVVDTEKFTKTTMLSADPIVYQKDKYVRVLYYRKSCAVVN